MKFIRLLSTFLLWVAAIATLLAVVAISPMVQTWVAQRALTKQTQVHGSLGELSARFGKVEITDLRLDIDGAILTVPSLKASLPVTTAALKRKFMVERLAAKGWTLDLSHKLVPTEAPAQGEKAVEAGKVTAPSTHPGPTPAQICLQVFHEILGERRLPYEISLDGVELEGDILLSSAQGDTSSKMHVVIRGGGIAAGREGALELNASGLFFDSKLQVSYLDAHGSLILAMDPDRSLNHIGIKADLLAKSDSLKHDLNWSIEATAARGAGKENYSLEINQDGKRLVTIGAQAPSAKSRLEGTWKLDLKDSDLAPFVAERYLPSFAAVGEGAIIADLVLARIHTLGHLKIVASGVGILAGPLGALGTVTADTHFNVIHSGQSLRFEKLSIALIGARPIAIAEALQPFECDEMLGNLRVVDPSKDWLALDITGLPLDCLSGLFGNLTIAGEDAEGKFAIKTAKGVFSVRPTSPFTAKAVSVRRSDKILAHDLDLSLSLLAESSPTGWQLQWAPLTIASAGQVLAGLEGKFFFSAKAGQPVAISGNWKSDLKALVSRGVISDTSWITASSASGDFSAKVGSRSELDGQLTVVGPAAAQSIASRFHLDVGANGGVAFRAPIIISLGSAVSELNAAGTWSKGAAGNQIAARVNSKDSSLEHLQQLIAPLAALSSVPMSTGFSAGTGEAPTPGGTRDRFPFWGDWYGYVTLAFDHFKMGDADLKAVRGIFNFDHTRASLDNGTSELPDHSLAMAKGSISFKPGTEVPYTLNATAELGEVDGAPLFGETPKGKDPLFYGRFAVVRTLKGSGINLDDLKNRIEDEFRFSSKGGIIRLLKTNVGESLPEKPTTAGGEILGTMGDAVGAIFGTPKPSLAARRVHPSKNVDAILNFTYDIAEFRYDQLNVTASRGADHTFHLTEISLTGPDERITGTGEITYVKGVPLSAQPLSVDLHFSFHGRAAKYLTTAGLLPKETNEKDFTPLNQPIHFGGTLLQIDKTQWHDLLVKAALVKADETKKAK